MSARKPDSKSSRRSSAGRRVAPKSLASRLAEQVAGYRSGGASPRPRDETLLRDLGQFVLARKLKSPSVLAVQQDIHSQTLSLSRQIDRPNFRRLGEDDLERMVRMYDDRFFDGRVLPLARAEGLSFKLSSRMTRIAGRLTTYYDRGRDQPRRFEMTLSTTLLFQTFEDVDRPVVVTGRKCKDRLEAMQRVTEHEFTHLVEMLVWNDGTCSQSRFQGIANRVFAHTDYQHDLITQQERAARKFNIRVGDQVAFLHEDRQLSGRVNRITRRATVLVPHPKGERFTDGHRYLRFYVPLEKLRRVK